MAGFRKQGPGFRVQGSAVRSGMSLLEVLIAIFVITFGLLGVAALLPLGAMHMSEIERLDRTAACGSAWFHDVQLRRMAQPAEPASGANCLDMGRWVWNGIVFPPMNPNPVLSIPVDINGDGIFEYTALTYRTAGIWRPVMLDPLGYVQMDLDADEIPDYIDTNTGGAEFHKFPYTPKPPPPPPTPLRLLSNTSYPFSVQFERVTVRMSPPIWTPGNSNPPDSGPPLPPPAIPMPPLLAERFHVWQDDVAVPAPKDIRERPRQMYLCTDRQGYALPGSTLPANVYPLYGQYQGDYSSMVMISPAPNERYLPLASQQHNFDVSVVVFHKRDPNPGTALRPIERIVCANMTGGGYQGGDVKLTTSVDPTYLEVKRNQWLLLCGASNANVGTTLADSIYQWYRVVVVDSEIIPVPPPPAPPVRWERHVTLSGPDWLVPGSGPLFANHWCDKAQHPSALGFTGAPFDLDGDGMARDAIAVLIDGVANVYTGTVTVP